MATRHHIMHQKNGATFANWEEALADLQSHYPEEQKAAIDAWHASMVDSGIMLKPVEITWNQDNFTLTVIREISDFEAYLASRPFSQNDSVAASSAAGWTNIGAFAEDI